MHIPDVLSVNSQEDVDRVVGLVKKILEGHLKADWGSRRSDISLAKNTATYIVSKPCEGGVSHELEGGSQTTLTVSLFEKVKNAQ